jgi:hypothetical protein
MGGMQIMHSRSQNWKVMQKSRDLKYPFPSHPQYEVRKTNEEWWWIILF